MYLYIGKMGHFSSPRMGGNLDFMGKTGYFKCIFGVTVPPHQVQDIWHWTCIIRTAIFNYNMEIWIMQIFFAKTLDILKILC